MNIVRLRGFQSPKLRGLEGQIWGFFRTNFGGASGAWPSAHVWRPIFSRHQISIVGVSHCHNGEIHRNFDLKFCSGQGISSSGQIVRIHCYISILDGNTYGGHSLCIFDQGIVRATLFWHLRNSNLPSATAWWAQTFGPCKVAKKDVLEMYKMMYWKNFCNIKLQKIFDLEIETGRLIASESCRFVAWR